MNPLKDKFRFYAHGKLLISGEYFVLSGAKALAVPTRFGQLLEIGIAEGEDGKLFWESLDEKGQSFLNVTFDLNDFKVLDKKGEVSHFLLQDILRTARQLNQGFLKKKRSINAISRLEFHLGWGLGSSSTLIQDIALWAGVDAFDLFFSVLEGSGYDIACASAKKPIIYQLQNSRAVWNEIDFHSSPAQNAVFIYLGKKQNSLQAVRQYRDNNHDPDLTVQISSITDKMIATKETDEFISLMRTHENIISSALRLEKVQDTLFNDFPGAVKSLGAWGGDFAMALSKEGIITTIKYFQEKGFKTIFPYKDILIKE